MRIERSLRKDGNQNMDIDKGIRKQEQGFMIPRISNKLGDKICSKRYNKNNNRNTKIFNE